MVRRMNDLPVASEMVQSLMEIGYVAVGKGLQQQAAAIFDGIAAARPGSEFPLIGLGVTNINFGDFVGGSKVLLDALQINPNSGLAKCFLAIATRALGGKQEADDLAKEVTENCDDATARALAEAFIAGKDVEYAKST